MRVDAADYNRAVTLYTRTGDTGETSLFDGTRVAKSDARVDAYGAVDELGAWIGLVRADVGDASLDERLAHIQRDLFALGSRLADPSRLVASRHAKALVAPADVERLERWIDEADAELPPLRSFILAGGTRAGAGLHVARTVCRRAERRVVSLGPEAVEPLLVVYLNRLSDLLFVLARLANARAGAAEQEW